MPSICSGKSEGLEVGWLRRRVSNRRQACEARKQGTLATVQKLKATSGTRLCNGKGQWVQLKILSGGGTRCDLFQER